MLILELLSRRAMHGYELVQAIKAATREGLEFGEGCVYPILHRLEEQGLLKAARESASGRTRVVYRVTRRGKSQLARTVSSWRRVVAAVNHVFEGGDCGHPAVA